MVCCTIFFHLHALLFSSSSVYACVCVCVCVCECSVAVVENGWCELCPTLLLSDKARQWEKSLSLMERLVSRCDFTMHLGRLEELKKVMYMREAASEDDGMDYAQLLMTIEKVTSHIRAVNKEL